MKKSYIICIRVVVVLLMNLFFIILFRHIPMSASANAELLASVISTVSPNGTYFEQVELAQQILRLSSDESLEHTVNSLGVFTNEITPTSRRAAIEALSINSEAE